MAKKRGRKSKSGGVRYFTEETQQAIIDYNKAQTHLERSRIFQESIYTALDKLVENVIHTWKFYHYETTYDDLKIETVSFLVEKLDRYTQDLGKAYSFFTIVAKNYLIQRTTAVYKAKSNTTDLSVVDMERNLDQEVYDTSKKEQLQDFIKLWSEYLENNLDRIFSTQRDRAIADSVIELFKTCDEIEDFSKKKLYILIRERAGVKTQHITKVVNLLRKRFVTDYQEYCSSSYFRPSL